MFNPFKKTHWKTVPASHVRPGDVVNDMFEGEVLYIHTTEYQHTTLVSIVLNMRKELCGSKIASINVSPNRLIKVAQK